MRLFSFIGFLWAAAALAQAPEGRTYAPGPFERLLLDGAVQVKLVQGERDEVFIHGDADVQDAVQVRVFGNRLVIHSSGAWKFWNNSRIQADVQLRNLRQIVISGASNVHAPGPFRTDDLRVHISGAGLVRFDELNAQQLRLEISGAGDGQLAGQVKDLRLHVSGKSKVVADQLRAANAAVAISGVANAQLWVTDNLKVSVSGVGTIDYWGQPQVSRSTSGLAKVNARGDKR